MRRIARVVAFLSIVGAACGPGIRAAGTGPGGFEMTTYYVGFLLKGALWTPDQTPEVEKLQAAHLANIQRLAQEGKLILAGPFTDGGDLRGMFVFQVGSIEEARALAESDPMVKAGRLKLDLHPWYAAKGIRVDRASADPNAR